MSPAATALVVSAAAIAVLMLTTWVVSLIKRNASIIDPVWGFGFVVVAWVVRATVTGYDLRQWVLVTMVTLWG